MSSSTNQNNNTNPSNRGGGGGGGNRKKNPNSNNTSSGNTNKTTRSRDQKANNPKSPSNNNHNSGQGNNGSSGVCFEFQNNGSCRFGSRCKYSHTSSSGRSGGNNNQNRNGSSSSSSRTSANGSKAVLQTTTKDDTVRFIKHLSQVPQNRLGSELIASATFWKKSWQDSRMLDGRVHGMMLEVLAKTPGSCSIEPPSIDLYEQVAKEFLSSVKGKDNEIVLTAVKTIADSVARLLQFEWNCPRERVKDVLTYIVASADSQLKKQYKDHRLVGSRLNEFLDDLEKPWRIKIMPPISYGGESDDPNNEDSDDFENENPLSSSSLDWKKANMSWLANPKTFAPMSCPAMKLVYNTPEEYIHHIYQLWVAMTFCDGHGAIAPHCRSRNSSGNGMSCNNALWPIGSSSSNTSSNHNNMRCRVKGCTNPPEFTCRIKSHDSLCGICAQQSIRQHMQGPGKYASTHIYDGKVKYVKTVDGIVYLCDVKSRNPPESVVHWKTTRRLSTPNLVGIIRLSSRGVPLQLKDSIKWGEIVFHPSYGGGRDEYKHREKGEVAVNLSSILEIDPEYLENGCSVAIIDCMTFVPEWIPVLKALEIQKAARLPFDNGRPLNLYADQPLQFQSIMDGDVNADELYKRNRKELIGHMIDHSIIEPICEIRRDPNLRDEIITKLERLVVQTTLDKMQLISFIDALQTPCHLVQGPPGTGKSYFGVVLVRALMMIRDMWVKKSKSSGSPPILVLSYKNLAIDSFLVDLVKAEPSLLSGGSKKMIRIGGQCKDPRLSMFSESNASQSDVEVKTMRQIVDDLHNLQQSIEVTLQSGLSSFFSYKLLLNDSGVDPSNRRKALIDATNILMESIVRHYLLKKKNNEKTNDETTTTTNSILTSMSFLELKEQKKPSNQVKKLLDNPAGDLFVKTLVDGYRHYPQDHWGEMLMMWLSGQKPLPCCSFPHDDQQQCHTLAMTDQEPHLCDKHRCVVVMVQGDSRSSSNGTDPRCLRPCFDSSTTICAYHCCRAKRCRSRRMAEQQNYCSNHACRRCVDFGLLSAKQAEDRPPRNVCSDHPLCLHPSCLQFCDPKNKDDLYCEEHLIQKCMALTKKGKPCKGNPISRWIPYCKDHKHMNKDFESNLPNYGDDYNDSDDDDDNNSANNNIDIIGNLDNKIVDDNVGYDLNPTLIQYQVQACQAKKRNGEACPFFATPGSLFCFNHLLPSLDSLAKVQVCMEIPDKNDTTILAGTSSKGGDDKKTKNANTDTNVNDDDDASFVTAASDSHSTGTTIQDNDKAIALEVDEMDFDFNEAENIQHLRDVFELKDDDSSLEMLDPDQEDDSLANKGKCEATEVESMEPVRTEPLEWDWQMSYEDRWNVCLSLMEMIRRDLQQSSNIIRRTMVDARRNLQQARVRAKARAYESKSVIGGTIVGCISRLESIRATRPFAVVVEEASEVLEPLLLSCLTESTLKLQMIGDHRQLQPSVMSRFDFEICNKINISMFQRLIEAPMGHAVPSTVLSVQRRMRQSICDLTRNYYTDVITIEDHASCATQKVGQRLNVSHQWQTKGREVPGIGPHIFLWTHNGVQKRSHVGISRINEDEARMACALVAYLIECMVPRASIAVLTPYKGQLMLIRDLMLKDATFKSSKMLSRDSNDTDVCRVSTVDRFQGDEEDIIICSLVVDEKSKTGFVKLVNRMIVMLSRARLGLYVLGNTAYFEQQGLPKHWKDTMELFQKPGFTDSAENLVTKQEVFGGIQSGSELSLCCPVHRHITKMASTASDLNLGFCTEICNDELSCGHKCGLPCHWQRSAHTKQCLMTLQSPCQRHAKPLACHEVYANSKNAPANVKFTDIVKFYHCPHLVSLTLPCGHQVEIACWQDQKITAGEQSFPVCNKESILPYKFASCTHSKNVTCSEYQKFTENPNLIKCKEVGDYNPTCGHTVRKECWQINEYLVGSKIFDCQKTVSETLPRCGHEQNLRCSVASKLLLWTGVNCEEVGKVKEGVAYGSQDHACKKKALLIRHCGHNTELDCHEAFVKSVNPDPCFRLVNGWNPNCGHPLKLKCNDAAQLKGVDIPDAVTEYTEGKIPALNTNFPFLPPCKQSVQLVQKCGHTVSVTCAQVRKPRLSCKEHVTLRSPLCGHDVVIACHLQTRFSKEIWPPETFESILGERLIPNGSQNNYDISSLDSDLRHAYSKCKSHIHVEMECGHRKEVDCKDLEAIVLQKKAYKCTISVPLQLNCGHSTMALCHEVQEYIKGIAVGSIKCSQTITQKCWNHDCCTNLLSVACGFNGIVACDKTQLWTCNMRKHTYEIKMCSVGYPLNCPGCSDAEINQMVSKTPPHNEKLIFQYMALFPTDTVTVVDRRSQTSKKAEKTLIKRYQNHIGDIDLWDRNVFTLRRVICFRHLKVQKKSKDVDWFNPREFLTTKMMNGIMTKTFTNRNLQKVVEKEKGKQFTLLIGCATVIQTKVCSDGEFPTDRKQLQTFLSSVGQDGNDSMLYTDKSGFENLIVWEPYPIFPLFKVNIDRDRLRDMANVKDEILNLSPASLLPIKILYKNQPPKEAIHVVTQLSQHTLDDKDDSDDDEEDDLSTATNENHTSHAIEKCFASTSLEGLLVQLQWNGGIDSGEELSSSLETELEEKMQFINPGAQPFSALKRLRTLLDQNNPKPILRLLLAAEASVHSLEDAKEPFEKYIEEIQASLSEKQIHPWALLLASRILPTKSAQFLATYKILFPLQDKYLTPKELESTKAAVENFNNNSSTWQDVLNKQWSSLKDRFPSETQSEAMEDLLKLTGLRKVKEEAIQMWNSALQLMKMDSESRKKNAVTSNYCFLGNPGTGKTTVCRLFAKILCDSQIRQEDTLVELTAQQAKDGGPDEFRKSVTSAMGGVLFIDEAYDLDPVGDFKGKPIVNELLTLCENQRHAISVVIAGYEDDFEKKIFPYNSGLKSRFKNVYFEDFDKDELSLIWNEMRQDRGWKEGPGVCTVVVKRLQKMTGKKGFGNAREVRNRLESACQSAMTRLGQDFNPDEMTLTVEDVIGVDPLTLNEKLQKVRNEIDRKIGWGRVKKCVQELTDQCSTNYKREILGKPPLDIFLNRLFLGNPGTGKTTCAKLYGQLLKELGLLSNGAVVSKTASDFVGSVVGESQKNTSAILENSRGKVLIIDEAYVLDDNLYGKQVLDTLVEKVQGGPSDDIAVLLLGYEDQMLQMIRNQNPGLSRRFPKEHAFYFDDYNDGELLEILNQYLKSNDVEASLECKEKALEVLRVQKQQANFGNAGSVELIVKGALLKASKRSVDSSRGVLVLSADDIDDPGTARKSKVEDPLSILDNLYRMEKVKAQLDKMRKTWEVSRQDGDEAPKVGHFVFTGSPGTGKTTVARAIADVLFSLGVIPSNKIVETSAVELQAGFVGQTASKVNEILKDAKGGVLFIDEAYNLGIGPFAKEACDTIVAAMTSDEYKDLVIVIAGYASEIDSMLAVNQGLKSRFTHYFEFPDWDSSDCTTFFDMLAAKKKFVVDKEVSVVFAEGCQKLIKLKGWGNGRDVTKLWEETKSNRDARVYESGETEKVIILEDVTTALESMIRSRQPKNHNEKVVNHQNFTDLIFANDHSQTKTSNVQKQHCERHHDLSNSDVSKNENMFVIGIGDRRDEGVSDEIWDALLASKRREELEQKELQRKIEEYEEFLARQAEVERLAKIRHEEEMERIRLQEEKEARELAERIALEAERKRKHDAEMERQRLEQERQKQIEEMRKKQAIQQKLQSLRPCPAGFNWYKASGGWRCAAGGHYVSDEELRRNFTF